MRRWINLDASVTLFGDVLDLNGTYVQSGVRYYVR